MANNDPIKDYNPLNLRLDRLQEKMEMYVGGDDPVTDLHDCSNDLSDAGSRREEYEHAKFAENMRNKSKGTYNNYNNTSYSNRTSKTTTNSAYSVLGVIIFVIICVTQIGGAILTFVFEIIDSITDEYSYTEDTYQIEEDNTISNFSIYKKSISIETLKTQENDTYIFLYNLNDESFSDLKVESVFYDEYGSILGITDTYVNTLISDNIHLLKIIDAPVEYAKCEHNLVNEYGEYSDITKDNLALEVESLSTNNNSSTITLSNYNAETIDYAEVIVAYIKDGKLLDIKQYNFFDLEYGVPQDKTIRLYQVEDEVDTADDTSNDMLIISVNDMYIY